jgi:prenyltransferase beta subunit
MWIPLLLAEPSPIFRWLVHTHLLKTDSNHLEVRELVDIRVQDPLLTSLLQVQNKNGSWTHGVTGLQYRDPIYATAAVLNRLAFYGFSKGDTFIDTAVEFLINKQETDGTWNTGTKNLKEPDRYDWVPLITAIPLRALAAVGYAEDSRLKAAYSWLKSCQLDDGGFPTGNRHGKTVLPAGYRRIPHSKFACRTNTTFSLSCFALHPNYKSQKIMKAGMDLLLSRVSFDRQPLGYEVARQIGIEKTQGFFTYFAKFDLSVILQLASQLGVSIEDSRIHSVIEFLQKCQTRYKLWTYLPIPHISRWVTYDLLKSLTIIDQNKNWISIEPITPFKLYNPPTK